MRVSLRAAPAFLLALLVTLAVACKGGDSDDSSSNEPAPDAAVSNAIEALGRSADDFQESVESLQGEMSMDMRMGEMAFSARGDFAFESPDKMHLTMKFDGGEGAILDLSALGDVEVLLLDGEIYMKVPVFGGWVKASLDDLGLDAEDFEKMLSDEAPFDYSGLIESIASDVHLQELGDEELDGGTYRHYRMETDFESLMEAFSGALGEDLGGAGVPTDRFSGPVEVDLWLDMETLLPHKVVTEASVTADGMPGGIETSAMAFKVTVVMSQYNGRVSMPEAPEDAVDLSELGEEWFGAFEGD